MSKYIFLSLYIIINNFYIYHYITSLQLNNYKLSKIIDFNNNKLIRFSEYILLNSIIFILFNYLIYSFAKVYLIISNLIYLIIFIIILVKNKSNFIKTPLKFTNRIKRLYLFNFISTAVILITCCYYIFNANFLLIYPCLTVVSFLILILSFVLILPFEKLNNYRYIFNAKKTFNKNIIKIGITGSYGKTSVKKILEHILQYKYNVVCSKKNYNTELGLSISSKDVTNNTDIFIAEMGARNKGDIKKLCNICKINIGVITGICNQHLETFKNIDNIISTKSEILQDNPIMFFNGNNEYVKKIYSEFNGEKYITYNNECYVDNISYSSYFTTFNLHINNDSACCKTKLLGKSAIENILLSSYISYYLGLNINEIAFQIETLPYITHRLEVRNNGKFTIIDDSYNSNEKGVLEALNVLSLFTNKKYVLVSGMVELGENEKIININLGKAISLLADKVILINTVQSKYILNGLLENDFNKENIYIYSSVSDAINNFNNIILDNSVLLIMSDLPSNYSR